MTTARYETERVFTETTDITKTHPHPATYEAQIAITVLIAILGLWSTFGNIVTILAIGMHKEMQKKSNYFIFSLALSDLISGMIASPLWLYRRTWGYEDWRWGEFLCKLFWFTDESTSYCTATHIASFAIWRYIGIKWPFAHGKISERKVKIWIISLWIITVIFGGAVFCTFYQAEDRSTRDGDKARWPSCSVITTEEGLRRHNIYYTFSSSTFMLLPMAVLLTTSILITKELIGNKTLKSQCRKKTEKSAIGQLTLISASFFLGYIPNLVYVTWTTRTEGVDDKLDYWVHVGCYFALRTSECLNPIVYNVSSERMRKSSIKVLRYLWNGCRSDAEVEFDSTRKENREQKIKSSTGKWSQSQELETNTCDMEMTITSPKSH